MLEDYSPALITDFVDSFSKLIPSFELNTGFDLVQSVLNFTYGDCARYLDVTQYSLNFDEQQIKLLTILLSLLFVNLFIIVLMWRSDGPRVVKKFKKPITRKVIEELKRSVDQLKLPKVYSPRI